MATRRETSQQKNNLKMALRLACEDGTLRRGELAPSLRQLADEYSVSRKVASKALQELVNEGLFYTVERVGTFVGQKPAHQAEYYLYLQGNAEQDRHHALIEDQMRSGFEERMSILGGAVLTLSHVTVQQWYKEGALPPLAGVFNIGLSAADWRHMFVDSPELANTPMVRFGNRRAAGESNDLVSFDDFQGGLHATEYLLKAGHRKIAFLGLHSIETPQGDSLLEWSSERERGWQSALQTAGVDSTGLSFHPPVAPYPYDIAQEVQVTQKVAGVLLDTVGITAVVAANDAAAQGLLLALKEKNVPATYWPAIIGFDSLADFRDQLVTSAQLPWHQVGLHSAELLWQRHHGQLSGEPVHRKVAMRIITRLTSQSHWSNSAREVMLAS